MEISYEGQVHSINQLNLQKNTSPPLYFRLLCTLGFFFTPQNALFKDALQT